MKIAPILVVAGIALTAFVPAAVADDLCVAGACVPVPCTTSVVRCATEYCHDNFAICNWRPPIQCLYDECMPP